MTKVVYNNCFGGFSLSDKARQLYAELKGIRADAIYSDGFERDDPVLVQVVETLGAEASGSFAELAIAEIPQGALYRIDEYDGAESVMTQDDYDWSVAK